MTTAPVHRGSRLYVKKFGGTSVGSLERIGVVAEQIAEAYRLGEHQVIVCSAMAGETNRLYALAQQLGGEAPARELDMLVATGEQVSIALLCIALQQRGVNARSLLASQVPIRTSSMHGAADIEQIDSHHLQQLLHAGIVPVVAGFQGVDAAGNITTLGRGGSDTTAVALAAALAADECQIFTDVDGVFTTDPAIEPTARKLDCISFTEMLALARHGAKVLHPDSVATAQRYRVPLRVLSSFTPGQGTLIEEAMPATSRVTGIAIHRHQALLTHANPLQAHELRQQIQALLRHCGVSFETDDSASNLWFGVQQQQYSQLVAAMAQLNSSAISCKCFPSLSRLSVVAGVVPSISRLTQNIDDLLEGEGIDVKLTSCSTAALSVWVDEANTDRAVRVLHHGFGLNKV
ncbi:aspartate kinase [Shewanella sp. YIC-542]|uniref:aspartate kinase n=1 Tax=Shewanella mytili TaxID=3377111 RepID=UPI00398EEC2C